MTGRQRTITRLLLMAFSLMMFLVGIETAEAQDMLIRGGTVLTITNGDHPGTDVMIRDGKIVEIGQNLQALSGMTVIDAEGKFVLPGILDDHSHMGVDRGINEGSRSVVPEVSIADVIRHDDPSFFTALAGGITTIQTMHGSANSIGGQNETIKLKWGRPWEELVFEGAPIMLKFALGENVRRSSSDNPTRYPRSRSGVAEVMRESFTRARNYMNAWQKYEEVKAEWDRANRRRRGFAPLPPKRDLQLEVLAGVLKGEITVRCHAYRADEIAMMMEVCEEFGIPAGTFEHCLDGYKVAPEMARLGWAASVFADSWAYKIEAYEAIPYKMIINHEYGVRTAINSDSAERVRRLFQETARGVKYGGVPENECLKMITIYPAMNLGIDDRVGSLEVGKDGDIAIFSHYPLYTQARCEMTIIDGEVFFDRSETDVAETWVEGFTGGDAGASSTSTPVRPAPASSAAANLMPGSDDWVITGGTVVTVTGEVIENGTIVVEDGIITAVRAEPVFPTNMQVFDATGFYVFPGLIDAGTGLGLQEAGGMDGPIDNFELGDYNPHLEAYIAVDQNSEILGCQRVGGFTTVVTGLSGRGAPITGWDSLINLWGYTPQAMAVEKRIGLRVNLAGGGGRRGGGGSTAGSGNRAEDLKAYFLEGKAYAARAEMAARGEIDNFEWDIRLEGIAPAATGELPVIFEASSESDIKDAVAFAEELGLKYIIRGGRDAWKITDFLKEHDVKLLFNGIHATPGRDEPYDIHYATPAILNEAGINFAIYSGGTANVFSLTYEAGMATAFGLPIDRALQCLTIDAARILGVDDRLGSIEEGKIANLLITTGNPVDYTSQVKTMFIGGQKVPWDDKFSRLWQKFSGRAGEIVP